MGSRPLVALPFNLREACLRETPQVLPPFAHDLRLCALEVSALRLFQGSLHA